MLGRAKKVMIEKENTTIVNDAGKKADIEARISLIKAQIEETSSDYDKEKLLANQPSWITPRRASTRCRGRSLLPKEATRPRPCNAGLPGLL